jgi:biotin operon repressor
MTPADTVLLALVLREQETVCVPVAELAEECGLSEAQVRRALRELRQDGRIIPAGKRRNTTVWRVPDHDPGARSAAPSPERRPPSGTDGSGGRSAERLTEPTAQPPAVARADDEEELSEEEWARRRAIGLRHAYAFLDRYDEVIGEPDQPEGECVDCGRWSMRRWSLGMSVLCRACRSSRARAAEKAVVAPLPPAALVVVEPGPHLADELAARLASGRSNGNGSGPSVWDEPDF